MLKTLLKKQLLELNRSFFVSNKTGKSKSSRSAAFTIVLFVFLMVFAIGGIFFYMSYMMRPLITFGMSWLYFSIMGATAALFGICRRAAVERQIAGNASEKRSQKMRALRRDGIPDSQIGIADIFLAVLAVRQNIHGDPHTVCPIFTGSFSDGLGTALPVKLDDLFVLHQALLSCFL